MNRRAIPAAVAVAAIVGIAGLWLAGGRGSEPAAAPPAAEKKAGAVAAAPKPTPAPTPVPSDLPPELAAAPAAPVAPAEEPGARTEINLVNGMDPEDQPRAFYVMDFTSRRKLPPGFEADGVVATPQGLQLAPPEPGQENAPRQGTLISPPEPFAFPSNALAPLWREQVPEGTDVMVEVQVSPDGEHWGPWQYIGIDNDSHGQIEPFYPDGRPNPNYGYTPGGLLVWGDLQFNEMRYRITLFSENEGSPTIEAFRGFYQDSTMGSGRIATVADVAADLIGPAPDTRPAEEINYNPAHNPDEHLEVHEQTREDVTRDGQ